MKKNVRKVSVALCAILLLNTAGAGAFAGLSSALSGLTKALPTIVKAVGAVAAVGQIATTIAVVAGGSNIDQAAAQTALGVFGAIGGAAGSFNAAGDTIVLTENEKATLAQNKQNLMSILPAEAPTNKEGKNWAKITLPAAGARNMIELPKISSGSRAGQENKIIIQVTKLSRTDKSVLKADKPIIQEKSGIADTTVAPATKLNYKITFYAFMNIDGKDAVELANIILPTLPKQMYGYVKPNGELDLLCSTQGILNFTSIPAQFSAQEWQNGTARNTTKAEVEKVIAEENAQAAAA